MAPEKQNGALKACVKRTNWPMIYAAVFVGGACGVLLRNIIMQCFTVLGIGMGVNIVEWYRFTGGTFVSNMLACFLLAAIGSALVVEASKRRKVLLQAALCTGFCGGLSTMSTFAMESVSSMMILRSNIFAIIAIIVLYVICGVLCALAGSWCGNALANTLCKSRNNYVNEV